MAAEAFEHGLHGDSVRAFPLTGLTTSGAHGLLVQAGFRCRRLALAGHRARDGSPQWRTASGAVTAAREQASSEYVYAHPDGGIVRIFPDRGPTVGFDELMEETLPFARRSLREVPQRSSFGWDDEVAVVSEKGVVLPKLLRVRDGLRYDPGDRLRSYRLARAAFAEQRIPLRASARQPLPSLPMEDAGGLSGAGLTLVPRRDFWGSVKKLQLRMAEDPTIEARERNGDLSFYFAGDRDVRGTLIGSCIALASLTIHRGAYVISVDPIGYEASVDSLIELLSTILPRLDDIVAYATGSGADVTEALARYPSNVIGSTDPSIVASAAVRLE